MTGLEADVRAVLDRRLNLDAQGPLAVGLSGGGDSLALLLLAAGWAKTRGRRLLALTVDHRLHPDSARWTAMAAAAAAQAGADWRGLAWTGPKPASGLAEAARAARHRLLAAAAREAGAGVILLGHTADDVAEGELMRQADAPSLGRLREWGPSPVWPQGRDIFLLRPLLGARRAALRDWLAALGETWLDDPANEDATYARVRARRRLSQSPSAVAEGPRPVAPPGIGGASAGQAQVTPDGRIFLARAALTPHTLAAALLCVGGGETPPRGARLARLFDQLQQSAKVTASLAGARIMVADEDVEIAREAGERARGGLAGLELAAGETAVWDGRYEVSAETPLVVGPLAGRMGRLSPSERAALKALPAHARSALPVLESGGRAILPRPFGAGPATVRELVSGRFAAAVGDISREP